MGIDYYVIAKKHKKVSMMIGCNFNLGEPLKLTKETVTVDLVKGLFDKFTWKDKVDYTSIVNYILGWMDNHPNDDYLLVDEYYIYNLIREENMCDKQGYCAGVMDLID